MTAIAPELRGRLRDVCAPFASASEEYVAAIAAKDEESAALIFARMQLIAQSFWAGAEYAKNAEGAP